MEVKSVNILNFFFQRYLSGLEVIFFVLVISYSISPIINLICSCIFQCRSIDHTFDKIESGKKNDSTVLAEV